MRGARIRAGGNQCEDASNAVKERGTHGALRSQPEPSTTFPTQQHHRDPLAKEAARFDNTVRLLLVAVLPRRAGSIDDDVINRNYPAGVLVINTHASAGSDRASDHFAVRVHHVTGPVENIPARGTLVNNESFVRLVTRRRPTLIR